MSSYIDKQRQQTLHEEEIKVTEFELQLWRVFYGFLRWQEECEKNASGTLLSGNELAILHIIRMNNRPKTITDIERLLNRNDTHNIRYSIKKLLKLGLIKKTLSNFNVKNYFFEITEAGIKDTDNFSNMRKSILVRMFKELNFNLEEMSKNLIKIKAIYDEADRAVAQNMASTTYASHSNTPRESLDSPRGRILLVEDHPTTAKVTKTMLSDLNYQVDIASSGDSAISSTENNNYDIIFMDIELPDIDGFKITKKIRSNQASTNIHTPIIGLTAHVSEENRQSCISAGMNAVFTKPLIKEKIEDIFAMFIPKHNTHTANVQKIKDDPSLPELKGTIINLDLGATLVGGNQSLAKEAIEMLVESFAEELTKLELACQSQDLATAQSMLHKLRGGISYCGVPRLNEACIQMDDYLKAGKIDLMQSLYQRLRNEFDAVQSELEN